MKKAKARIVAQGCRTDQKNLNVHDTSTLGTLSIRVTLSAAAAHGMRIFSHDISHAYLQSKDKLARPGSIPPVKAEMALFGLKKDEIFEPIRPLCEIYDASDYRG